MVLHLVGVVAASTCHAPHRIRLLGNMDSSVKGRRSSILPDEEHVGVGRLLEAGLLDGVPPGKGVEDLEKGHGVGDPRYPLESRVDHVRVHHLSKGNHNRRHSLTPPGASGAAAHEGGHHQ